MLSAAGALMWVAERVCAGQVDAAVRAADDAFGLFEPFRRMLVGKLRTTEI
jgi:hypothetical protein